MSKADLLVERGADRLEDLSRKAAAKGGFAAKLADELAEDAVFLRKLKPSLIKARAKGRAPIARTTERETPAPSAPQMTTPQPQPQPKSKSKSKSKPKQRRPKRGLNPFLVAGAALAAGIVLAKVIDWRGHAHPRD
jgi:hypothetical protein